jgi:hypothetical protein
VFSVKGTLLSSTTTPRFLFFLIGDTAPNNKSLDLDSAIEANFSSRLEITESLTLTSIKDSASLLSDNSPAAPVTCGMGLFLGDLDFFTSSPSLATATSVMTTFCSVTSSLPPGWTAS